jgi:hypothetical protein
MEAPEERSLRRLLAPSLRALLTRVSRGAAATTAARRALSALSGFARALKFKYDDLQIGLEFDPEPGLADSGDLETDLTALLASVGMAAAERDASFFRVRFDRLTPSEKRYLRGMAELGPGPHRSGSIADRLGRRVTAVAPIRNALIAKGMIYSPAHGDTAFTVPLFDGFMKRTMPDWN